MNSFLILDAARMESEMETARALNPDFVSLYRGEPEETLASVAPYLFSFNNGTEFENWYFANGWGDAWGVLVVANEEMRALHKHFRRFLMVKTEDGEELYFRFYDPRVLRIFLPTCDREQLKEFFGPVDYYLCEDEDPEYGIVFSLQDGLLRQERITKEMVISFEPEPQKRRFSFF